MKLLIVLLACFSFMSYAANPLTLEQFQVDLKLSKAAKLEKWTWGWDSTQMGKYTVGGYMPPKNPRPTRLMADPEEKYKSVSLDDNGMPRAPILDQGTCGSCVPSAFVGGAMDLMLQRGFKVPILSIGELMWCGKGWQCSGAMGETIAADLIALGSLVSNDDVPYYPQNGRCPRTKGMARFGEFQDWDNIDGSARSIAAALTNRQPVMCGVAVDYQFQVYRSGVYNPANFYQGVNHYVKVTGLDCQDAVDAEGYCQFNAKGNLPPQKGILTIDNSWGEQYGDKGRIYMQMTNVRGTRTNAICSGLGNAQIVFTNAKP